jgi:hypothetical protein
MTVPDLLLKKGQVEKFINTSVEIKIKNLSILIKLKFYQYEC